MSNRLAAPPPQPPVQSRAALQQKYARSRHELLVVIILTLVNLALLALDSGYMLLFSASVPYIAVAFGIAFQLPVLLGISIFIAAVTLGLYFLCWLLCKRNFGWLVLALVLFILDTLCLVGFYLLLGEVGGIFDLIIHAVVLYHLIVGVRSGAQLRKLPEEEETPAPQDDAKYGCGGEDEPDSEDRFGPANSAPLRIAETDVKFRVLLEGDHLGHHICYRRVKRFNQLVIDNYIYNEVELLIEGAHELAAVIDGHTIAVGFDGKLHSYIAIDGTVVTRKARLY